MADLSVYNRKQTNKKKRLISEISMQKVVCVQGNEVIFKNKNFISKIASFYNNLYDVYI